MDTARFREFLPPALVCHPAVEELLTILEENGWYPDKLIAGRGLRYYPEFQRPKQIVIDLRIPPNEHKLGFYREHTGIEIVLTK